MSTESDLIVKRAIAVARLIAAYPDLPTPSVNFSPANLLPVSLQLRGRDEITAWAEAIGKPITTTAYEGIDLLGKGSLSFRLTRDDVEFKVWTQVELAKVPEPLLNVLTARWRDENCGACGPVGSAERCPSCARADVIEDRAIEAAS